MADLDDVNMDDLFGSDSESGDVGVEASTSDRPKVLQVDCPRYPRIQTDGKTCFARLSTIFGVQQTPFSPNTYSGEDQVPMVKIDDFGQMKTRMAPVHIIRWRYARNNKGERIRQSNTKMVKWSDGTMCLYVGEECFTMTESVLRVPQRLCTRSEQALQSQGEITSRLMFQPTSKAAASRGATVAAPAIKDQPIVLTPQVQAELRARQEAQEESIRLSSQSSKKRRGGPSATKLDADFLEEGSDIGATKAAYKKSVALSRERDSSRRLMDIKSGSKKPKRKETIDDDASDDSFIASDGDISDPSISDEE